MIREMEIEAGSDPQPSVIGIFGKDAKAIFEKVDDENYELAGQKGRTEWPNGVGGIRATEVEFASADGTVKIKQRTLTNGDVVTETDSVKIVRSKANENVEYAYKGDVGEGPRSVKEKANQRIEHYDNSKIITVAKHPDGNPDFELTQLPGRRSTKVTFDHPAQVDHNLPVKAIRIEQNIPEGVVTYERTDDGNWKITDKEHPQGKVFEGAVETSKQDGSVWKVGTHGEFEGIYPDGHVVRSDAHVTTGDNASPQGASSMAPIERLRNVDLTNLRAAGEGGGNTASGGTEVAETKSGFYFAESKDVDGTVRKYIIRTLEPGNTKELAKVAQSQIEDNVARTIRDKVYEDMASAPMVVRAAKINGQMTMVAIQEDAGRDVGSQLKQVDGRPPH